MKAIRGLKSGKAHGIDGWRYEEIKRLPETCIHDLAVILAKGARFGLSKALVAAKTTLLAKNPDPKSLHHIRPITVLGVIYRLTGHVIFKQAVAAWKSPLPLLISGGLPGRGVKDLAYSLKFRIEQAIQNKAQVGGFTLDLKKVFNTFPRWPVVVETAGSSSMGLRFLVAFLDAYGTTGAPEGDSLNVLAMPALATAFHWSVANDSVVPHGYADNWGWSTFNFACHRAAFVSVLNFSSSLRLEIDFDKSWHWSITKDFRNACLDLAHLFPSGDIPIRVESHVKDSGERFHYDRAIHFGNVKEKLPRQKHGQKESSRCLWMFKPKPRSFKLRFGLWLCTRRTLPFLG